MHVTEDFFIRKQREIGVTLNKTQKQAILHTEGELLLLASPGSGKTTTIIMRMGYLIEERGVHPSRIKAVTFSRASASDMKERFKRFFPQLPSADFSTIHSLAFEIVRLYFHKRQIAYQLIEGELEAGEQEEYDPLHPPLHKKIILRNLFKTVTGENMTDDQMDELTTYISYVKNKMIPAANWPRVKCDVPRAEEVLRAYETFKKSGAAKLLVDYDDMLTLANEALENESGLRNKYQQRYDYILTDESQDTSLVQHAIIEKLVHKCKNLCVVADDDQSIYTWRAAEPNYLLNFKQVYPQAAVLMMEQNYRSAKDIVNIANRFIKRNKNRYDKNMFTENPSSQQIFVKSLGTYKQQAKYLVQQISAVENLHEVAVLYRNNSSSITLMNEFERAGIPFYMKDTDNRFFSHWVVEDVLNFMRMTYNDKRPDILEKIYSKLNGYITRQQMSQLLNIHNKESVFDNLIQYVELQDYQVKQLQECKQVFQQLQGSDPLSAIRTIRTKLGYEKALDKMCERLGFRKDYLAGILNTLEEIADTLATMEDFAKRLKHLENAMRTSKFHKNTNAVTFSTLHSSKGLEFQRVYMIDLIDGIIPSKEDAKSSADGDSNAMEEAVRLFYVGMTRAAVHLELLSYKERDGVQVKESSFCQDVRRLMQPPRNAGEGAGARSGKTAAGSKPTCSDPDALTSLSQLEVGVTVKHRVFGQGEVLCIAGDLIELRFPIGVKKLSVAACLEMGLLSLPKE